MQTDQLPGIWSKVALGVTLVFFIIFFNAYHDWGVTLAEQRLLKWRPSHQF